MLISSKRGMITAKNILLFGLILLTTWIDGTQKQLSVWIDATEKPLPYLKNLNPTTQLNFKFNQSKFDKSLYKSIALERSFAQLKFKNMLKVESLISTNIKEDHSQEKAISLLQEYNSKNNDEKVNFINAYLKNKRLNTILPNGNPLFYQILKSNIPYLDFLDFIELSIACFKKNPDTTIQNKKGNTIVHLLLKKIHSRQYCDPYRLMIATSAVENELKAFDPVHKKTYIFPINNLNQILNIKNKKGETPLRYIFNKLHPLGPAQITKKFINKIRNHNSDLNSNIDSLINSIVQECCHHERNDNPLLNPIVFLFQKKYIYNNVLKSIWWETDENDDEVHKKLIINKDTRDFKGLPNSSGQSLPLTRGNQESYNTVDKLVEIKNHVENSYFRKSKNLEKVRTYLLSINAKIKDFEIYKRYILPGLLKRVFFSLICSDLSDSLNNIINKRKDNNPITEDDFNHLKNAAVESPLFSIHNKK